MTGIVGVPSLTEFLLARIGEEEQRTLAFYEAQRRAIELHESWPVLVEAPEPVLPVESERDSFGDVVLRMTHRVGWMTNREYEQRFGMEPPTTPILRTWITAYRDHPDFQEEWLE